MKAAARALLIIVLLLEFPACRLAGSRATPIPTEPRSSEDAQAASAAALPEKHTTVPIRKLEPPRRPTASDVEILWEIPQTPVDGFVIRYGYSRENLDNSARIAAADVEKIDDPVHGMVYHYLIKDVPADKKIYVTVSAFSRNIESTPSAVFEVAPAV